ncbi:unnamed protein product [Ilex paraguariensis]|uniref:Uncharacterized protein n=1 Tax=Ilex paraguariensis TaxID=185542 RepID=A0ABC8RVA9_9AQUA
MEEWEIQVEDEARYMTDDSREMDLLKRPCIYHPSLQIKTTKPTDLKQCHSALTITGREQFMNNLILRFYNSEARWQRMEKCLHVLDVYRKSLVFRDNVTRSDIVSRIYYRDSRMSRSAKQLYDAGVIIKRSHPSNQKFSFKGRVLLLPLFIIDETTESTFLNMTVFERCYDNISRCGKTGVCVAFTNFIENYFSSPWTLISVIAAGVLFGLTITQTVYSALQDYQGNKKPRTPFSPMSLPNNYDTVPFSSHCRLCLFVR